jgi:hypothetical protein
MRLRHAHHRAGRYTTLLDATDLGGYGRIETLLPGRA